jgi:hypothetical protein
MLNVIKSMNWSDYPSNGMVNSANSLKYPVNRKVL